MPDKKEVNHPSGDHPKGEKKEEGKKETKQTVTKKKVKIKRKLSKGKVYIQSSYNNTIVSIADLNGNVISWASSGSLGFKGAKRSTPYAATLIVKTAAEKARPTGIKEAEVFVKGIGGGREAAVRALNTCGIQISAISDVTPIPHNGCRPPKVRRV